MQKIPNMQIIIYFFVELMMNEHFRKENVKENIPDSGAQERSEDGGELHGVVEETVVAASRE